MRFLYNDPYALRIAVEQLANQASQAPPQRDQPIPVDVYRQGNDIVIEGALPGARLDDLELSCEEGLLTVRGTIAQSDRDFAVQEIPRGAFSRTLALPGECDIAQAKASFDSGIVRIVIPRQRQRAAHTIKVEVAESQDSSRIVMEKPDVIDAVKGQGYTDVQNKNEKRKGRPK
ncbi:MAG: Hsp20/alpha crystallin family protein [Chloroflexi bacterium]|nr:MAG: Hsp20/alpha crystallin family protein [Chloroflexota bacterium]TME44257.1 MAG: Hsp20/alpha crystallin family protein [Chloroflexota bacterium]